MITSTFAILVCIEVVIARGLRRHFTLRSIAIAVAMNKLATADGA